MSLIYERGITELGHIDAELQARNPEAFKKAFEPLLRAYEQINASVQLNRQRGGVGDELIAKARAA